MQFSSNKHVNKLNKRNRRNQKKVFLKAFILSIAICSAVVLAGVFFVFNNVRPPTVPQNPLLASEPPPFIDPSAPQLDELRPAFVPPEEDDAHEEDALIGAGLVAPAGFTDDDRKELFFTFLIMGMDEGVNVDTIMVAGYDGVAHEASIIGIPRDSLVNVSRRVKKINGAFPAGTLNGGGIPGGIAQMQREVMTIIGFVPDFYVLIDLEAFVRIVDTIGGVEIDVPFHMRYDDPYQDLFIDIPEGLQHMDGATALKFARFRRGNEGFRGVTDYERIVNQQTVIRATIENLLHPANLLRLPEFVDIFAQYVHTNISIMDMLWFASQLTEISGLDALSTYTMPTDGTSGHPTWYEFLDGPAIVELVNRTINPFNREITLNDLDITRNY